MSPLRFLLAITLFCAASTTRAEELKTLAGKTVTGSLKQIDDKTIVLETDAGPVETPLSQALMLDLRPFRGAPTDAKVYAVRLLDDSSILASAITYSGKDVDLMLLSGTTLKVPLTAVVSVLKDAQNGAISRQFRALAARGKLRSDRILILKDGELNAIDGTLGDIDADGKAIAFKRDGSEPIKARFDLLQGVVFLRTEVPAESAICKVIDQDGNTLNASKLDYDGKTLNVTIPTGARLALKGEAVAKLDFNLGRLTYLSDLEPAKLSESAFFGGFPTLRKDVNQDGRPIILLDRSFAKGLTLEGGTAIEYNLAGKYKDLKAVIGADTRAAEGVLGKTTVIVYGDGAKLLSEVVAPAELRPIALNVKDVATLRIVVEGPNFTGLSAYVTLADARVSQ
jgi:NPCBM/NEW2 domain